MLKRKIMSSRSAEQYLLFLQCAIPSVSAKVMTYRSDLCFWDARWNSLTNPRFWKVLNGTSEQLSSRNKCHNEHSVALVMSVTSALLFPVSVRSVQIPHPLSNWRIIWSE